MDNTLPIIVPMATRCHRRQGTSNASISLSPIYSPRQRRFKEDRKVGADCFGCQMPCWEESDEQSAHCCSRATRKFEPLRQKAPHQLLCLSTRLFKSGLPFNRPLLPIDPFHQSLSSLLLLTSFNQSFSSVDFSFVSVPPFDRSSSLVVICVPHGDVRVDVRFAVLQPFLPFRTDFAAPFFFRRKAATTTMSKRRDGAELLPAI